MKKIIYIVAIGGIMTLSSCLKKDYQCTCTSTGNISVTVIPEATKAQAETICKAGETYDKTNQTSGASCKLD